MALDSLVLLVLLVGAPDACAADGLVAWGCSAALRMAAVARAADLRAPPADDLPSSVGEREAMIDARSRPARPGQPWPAESTRLCSRRPSEACRTSFVSLVASCRSSSSFLLPLWSLSFGTEALGGERESNSLLWLLTRPLPRPAIYLAKFVALLPWTLALNLGGFALLVRGGGPAGAAGVAAVLAGGAVRDAGLRRPVPPDRCLLPPAGHHRHRLRLLPGNRSWATCPAT